MENKIYYINLYDCYCEVLTEKQKLYFTDCYFNDLSLSEMSENYHVSRNAVHKQIKEVLNKLDFYEEKLQMYQKRQKIISLLSNIDDNKLKNDLLDCL